MIARQRPSDRFEHRCAALERNAEFRGETIDLVAEQTPHSDGDAIGADQS